MTDVRRNTHHRFCPLLAFVGTLSQQSWKGIGGKRTLFHVHFFLRRGQLPLDTLGNGSSALKLPSQALPASVVALAVRRRSRARFAGLHILWENRGRCGLIARMSACLSDCECYAPHGNPNRQERKGDSQFVFVRVRYNLFVLVHFRVLAEVGSVKSLKQIHLLGLGFGEPADREIPPTPGVL